MTQHENTNDRQGRDERGYLTTLYRPEYDRMLIDHFKEGLSFESFAAVVDVHRATLYAWKDAFPSFKEAKERGEAKSLLKWERLGLAGTAGLVQGFNASCWRTNMANRFGWRDRHEVKTLPNGQEFGEVLTHKKIMEYIEKEEF